MNSAELGPWPGKDYIDAPFKADWTPLPERQWAAQHIREDGSEDFMSFRQEYIQRNPLCLGTGGSISYMPPTVQDYVRKEPNGQRRDIDWELAAIPLTEEEREERKQLHADRARDRRRVALQAATKGQTIVDEAKRDLAEAKRDLAEAKKANVKKGPKTSDPDPVVASMT